jgi:putative ABC transport system ATP-binding protein
MLTLQDVDKVYSTTEVQTRALQDVSLEVQAGEFVAIMGPSGCGKSTLLNILGLLDTPSSGTYRFMGEQVERYSERQLTALRRAALGFVFQSFNLIDDLTVAANVEVALLYRGISAAHRRQRVAAALEQMGVAHRARHFPRQLSGGQQQRVAIARATVARPKLILADEPTGNLHSSQGREIMELFKKLNDQGTTIIQVTHSEENAKYGNRIIELKDGWITGSEGPVK